MELWLTDKCFFLMLILIGISLIKSLKNEQTRQAFKRVFHRPLAVSSCIILAFYLLISVLDSIHFNNTSQQNDGENTATEIVSLLDKLIAPLGQVYEKTYSAPLALNLFSLETQFIDGKAVQRYPRLALPPAFLDNKTNYQSFIIHKLLNALFLSLLGTIAVYGTSLAVQQLIFKTRLTYPGVTVISALLTVYVGLFIISFSYELSRDLHLLGTGKIGQDIFYYTIKSIRTGLIIGTLTTLFMLPLAIFLGIGAGYFGGIIDDIIQYVYTTLSSIPGVLLITASVLSMQTYIANHPEQFSTLAQNADARLFALCLILGVTSWTSLCRLLRAESLKLREIDFVLAARAQGSSSLRIIRKHLLPNVMPIVLITLVLDFSYLVLAEAVLSYVGVGVSPMTISWGNMINGARLELARDPLVWWPMMGAFVFMFILVLAANLFADAIRDAFDPHHS